MLGRIITVVTCIALIALFSLLQYVSPLTAGPLGILSVFFLLFIVSVGLSTFVVFCFMSLLLIIHPPKQEKPSVHTVTKRAYYYGTILGLAPVMLAGISSVGGIGIYEVLLVLLFTAIGLLYVKKRL